MYSSRETESVRMKVAVLGPGAFGIKHLEAIQQIGGIDVATIVGDSDEPARVAAQRFGVASWTTDLAGALARPDIEAVILATPTPLHAKQAIQCLEAGKHVQVEIPMADNLQDAERLVEAAKRAGKIAMVGHTRRFNPSHRWIRNKVSAGELTIQQMDVQTYFLRRSNTNALGLPRNWTDHLLWHHACHTVDLFRYQTSESIAIARGVEGRIHPELGIAMDMSIQMKVPSGTVCTLSLSFNNDGPFGSTFRYICDKGTYVARYDDLFDGRDNPIDVTQVDVSTNGVELQDREFFAAIREGREPNSSVQQCLPTMQILDQIEKSLL